MERLLEIYLRLLEIHIKSKTTGTQFHNDTKSAYELGFDVFHTISEMQQDIGEEETVDCKSAGEESYLLIEEIKEILSKMVKENKDLGMDDLLRGKISETTTLCGLFKQYREEEKEKDREDEEEPEEEEPVNEEPKSKGMPLKK